MKVSLDWLNSYLASPASADDVERLVTGLGFPIDGRTQVGNDTALEVEITSNRSDCLSHLGIAREVAAASGRQLQGPSCGVASSAAPPAHELAKVENRSQNLCPVYTARVIRGVKVGPSPAWLVQRLTSVGLRSVNNVVDVTNFVLLEMGQPLHAFDLAKLGQRTIVVRTASAGESFTAIDGSKHALKPDMLVIADAGRAVAIAGVMGGLESEVSAATVDVLLESAMFDPLSVRRTSRALKLSSDSNYRFERGVDPRGVERASARAAQLIQELAGGTIAQGVIRVGQGEASERRVGMRAQRCNDLLGTAMAAGDMAGLLARLGLQPSVANDVITCTIPTHRLDLEREVDLIEEIGRLHGIDNVPVRDKITIVVRPVQRVVAARRALAQVLVAHGYHEAVTFSFVSRKAGEPFVPAGEGPVIIEDERRKAEPMLRPSLLPSLLSCRKSNQDVGNSGVRLYETAATWTRKDGQIAERRQLALLADVPTGAGSDVALRSLRGTVEELASQLLGGESALTIDPVDDERFAAAAGVSVQGQRLGVIGELSKQVQSLYDLQTPVVVAELLLEPLLAGYPPARKVKTQPRFPAIERDLSVVVGEEVAWRRVESAVRAAQPALLEDLRFLITYRGKQVGAGRKSVSFRMLFRDPAGTLRHEQVDGQVAAVVAKLKQELNAELRA